MSAPIHLCHSQPRPLRPEDTCASTFVFTAQGGISMAGLPSRRIYNAQHSQFCGLASRLDFDNCSSPRFLRLLSIAAAVSKHIA